MNHTFCLVMDKSTNDLLASKYFMDWLKETVEYLYPHNTLTTNEEFFHSRHNGISNEVSLVRVNQRNGEIHP